MAKRRPRVALFLFDIQSMEAVGGAERQWTDVYENINEINSRFNLFFFLDKPTCNALIEAGRLRNKNKLIFIRNFVLPQFFKNIFDAFDFILKLLLYRIDIIHCVYYSPHYYKRLRYLGLLPSSLRPKIVLTEVTSFTPYCYLYPEIEAKYNLRKNFLDMFYKNIKIDGIYTWYELTKKILLEKKLVKNNPLIYAVKYCFTDIRYFKPLDKTNIIIFASRLVDVKRPMWFVEAINIVKNSYPDLIKGWCFHIYGKGHLEEELREFICKNNLNNIIKITSSLNMSEAFGKSKIFVSCQDYENFTSLSMLEAMAAGNAIISRNVGQTNYFVNDGINGLLTKTDDINGIAHAIIELLRNPDKIDKMGKASIKIAQEVHNVKNFISELENFWNEVLIRKSK